MAGKNDSSQKAAMRKMMHDMMSALLKGVLEERPYTRRQRSSSVSSIRTGIP